MPSSRVLRMVSACDEPWSAMRTAPAGRHCVRCDKAVVDLTRVTAARAAAVGLVFGRGGLCARIRADAEGFAVFDERSPPSRSPTRAFAALVGVGVAACGGAEPAPHAACEPRAVVVTLPTPEEPTPSVASPVAPLRAAPAVLDGDGDGIADDRDVCPTEAAADTTDGCPRKVIVVTAGDVAILQKVTFASHQKALDAADKTILDETVKVLAQNPQITKVEIEGHTDSTERASLAKDRADVVVAYLVAKGVAPPRLAAVAYGDTRPIAPNTTAEGRQHNRRIEFHIVP